MLAIFKVLMQVSLDQSVKSIHCIIIVSLLRFILIQILSLSLSLSLCRTGRVRDVHSRCVRLCERVFTTL